RRIETARTGIARERPGDLDGVDREVLGQARRARAVDEALAVEEPERQLLVVAGGAHRDRERRAVDADLERLLDGDEVLLAVAHDLRPHAVGDLVGGLAGGAGHRHGRSGARDVRRFTVASGRAAGTYFARCVDRRRL